LAILRARSPEHARELAAWTGKMFPVFGVTESLEESRYRQAACLLADISWRAHPDYRGLQALNIIAHSTFTGISHAGRAYIALTSYYRFEGLNDDGVSSRLAAIAGPNYLEYAKLLGGMLAGCLSVLGLHARHDTETGLRAAAKPSDGNVDIVLVAPRDCEAFLGERLEGRLQQLAKLTGKKLGFRIG
jgi:exopolyphosphatase/guanosine-5'-triphosphate,3'-diphosphate pyrophosphatase